MLTEARLPEGQRSFGHRERCRDNLARTFFAFSDTLAGVRECRPERAWRPPFVAVVEVVDLVIVEVHRLLDESQSEHVQTEVEVLLGVAHSGGDVMKAENGIRHRLMANS